jgi:formylglycine-generating enzyme
MITEKTVAIRSMLAIASMSALLVMLRPDVEAQSIAHVEIGQSEDTVSIRYDLSPSEPGETYRIAVQLSTDGGKNFGAQPLPVFGDAGTWVKPGISKLIYWLPLDGGAELSGSNFVFRVSGRVHGSSPIVEFVQVKGGNFDMGDIFDEGVINERPVHEVRIDDFEMGDYEVTNLQFSAFLREYGSSVVKSGEFKGRKMIYDHPAGLHLVEPKEGIWVAANGYQFHPAVNVTWYGANEFCRYYGWRLPTEAEWEYAARAGGKNVRYGNGKDAARAGEINCADVAPGATPPSGQKDSMGRTVRVASYPPNGLDLFDMSGNVWEWCQDWYATDYYLHPKRINPTGPWLGRYKSIRGGSWFNKPSAVRVSARSFFSPWGKNEDLGFRVVRPGPHPSDQ